MQQAQAHLVLTAPLSTDGPIAEHVHLHGDGVKDIAFRVANAAVAFQRAVQWGAQPVMEPTVFQDEQGSVTKTTVAAYGDTTHSFIQYDHFEGVFFPGYKPVGAQDVIAQGAATQNTMTQNVMTQNALTQNILTGARKGRDGASPSSTHLGPLPTASIGISLVDHLAISLR